MSFILPGMLGVIRKAQFAINYSLDFDGVDDHISFGTDLKPLFDGSTALAFEVWFKFDTTVPAAGMMLFQAEYTDVGDSAFIRVALTENVGNKGEFIIRTTSGLDVLRHASALSTGTWYHMLCDFDGAASGGTSRIRIKSGGSNVGSTASNTSVGGTMATSSSSANTRIGTTYKTTRPFDGHIALMRIWDAPIDDAAFAALHGSGVPPFTALSDNGDYDNSADLQHSWLMEDSGDTIADEAIGDVDGTKGATGFPAWSTDVPS